jgi:hypothetical protein
LDFIGECMRLLSRLVWLTVSLIIFSLSCSVVAPPPQPSPVPTPFQSEVPPTPVPSLKGKIAFADGSTPPLFTLQVGFAQQAFTGTDGEFTLDNQ